MPLLPLFLLGDIVQCVFLVLLLSNKAQIAFNGLAESVVQQRN